jgi:putative aldouronate transport system substrate-binding protein
MQNGKKLACLALAMATILPVTLTGCKSSAAKVTYGKDSTTTLVMYSWGGKSTGVDRVEKEVNDYLAKKNAGYQIDWHLLNSDDIATKESTMLATNQPLDIAFTPSWLTGGGCPTYAQKGYLKDLGSLLNTSDGKAIIKVIGKDFLNAASVNGKYYGLPCNKEQGHSFGLLLQTKEMNKLGIKASNIKSLDDIAKYFDKVKKDGLIPICAANADHPFKLLDWDVVNGDDTSIGALDPSAGEKSIVDPWIASKTVKFYKTMKTYHDKGYITSAEASAKDQESLMSSGKYFCGSWSLKPDKAANESETTKLGLTQIYITPLEKSNREGKGALLSIPTSSTHATQAFNFISRLYTDKTLLNLMDFGIAGTDYTLLKDGRIDTSKANSDFDQNHSWTIGNQYGTYVVSPSPTNLYKTYTDFNNKCKALKSLGFTYDMTKVKTQYSALTNVIQTYYKTLFYGTTSNVDATVTQFKNALKTAGEAKVLADMNSQYSKFLKTKK